MRTELNITAAAFFIVIPPHKITGVSYGTSEVHRKTGMSGSIGCGKMRAALLPAAAAFFRKVCTGRLCPAVRIKKVCPCS
jgi:hypothetical protein